MTRAQKQKLARDLYLSGQSIDQIAATLALSRRTIHNYKSQAGDWEELRMRQSLEGGGEKLYKSFLESMHAFLAEIRDSDLKPQVKAEKISQIGDAFAKMKRVANLEDPAIYKHGIIKRTLTTLILRAQKSMNPECLEALIRLIEEAQEDLANVSL